jgi:peptidoglycan hydrolase-like protein with peptidoglycan-binding domain
VNPIRAVSVARGPAVVLLLTALLLGATALPAEANRRAAFPAESLGSRGVNVAALQHLLRHAGWRLPVDGDFGPATQAAVAAFQEANDLRRTGVVDERTWQGLVPALLPGAVGEAVVAAQLLLNAKDGAAIAESGTLEAATGAAVKDFQRRLGLSRSGIVDTPTWRALAWHFVKPDFRNSTLCDYHSGNGKAANWGTSATIAQLEAAAALFHSRTGLYTSVGELSFRYGGPISGHATHQLGLDVDFGLIRRDGRHCRRLGLDYRQAQYDRQMTRELIQAIYETAPGRVKLIYFNDPVLIREGLVVHYPNHGHHLHVRYCEVDHAQPRYRCAKPELPERDELEEHLRVAAVAAGPTAGARRFAPLDLAALRH